MKPSRTTGTRPATAPRMTPTSAPISRPPTAARTPIGSAGSGALRAIACSMTAILRRCVASSMPVPRPVTSAGVAPVRTATIALAAVVLPMPMSPMPTSSTPDAAQAGHDLDADFDRSERLASGHRRAFGHVRRTRRGSERGRGGRHARLRAVPPRVGPATPTSTTVSDAPDGLREDVDGRSAADEVGEHLGGHVRWVGRDAPPRDAVVSRRHDDRAARHRRERLPGDAGQVDGELLEAAEAARRLREPVEVVASAGHGGLVQPAERRRSWPGCRPGSTATRAVTTRSRPFKRHRQARHEQVGLVGHRREPLVGDPDEVAVGPGAGVHRHDPEPDLVAHHHDGSRTRLDRGEARRDRSVQDRVDVRNAVAQQRAEPEGQPVDEDRLGRLGLREGGGQVGARPRSSATTPGAHAGVGRCGRRARGRRATRSRGTTRVRRPPAAWWPQGRTGSCRCACRRRRRSAGWPRPLPHARASWRDHGQARRASPSA